MNVLWPVIETFDVRDLPPQFERESKIIRYFRGPALHGGGEGYFVEGAVHLQAVEQRGIIREPRLVAEGGWEGAFVWLGEYHTTGAGKEKRSVHTMDTLI